MHVVCRSMYSRSLLTTESQRFHDACEPGRRMRVRAPRAPRDDAVGAHQRGTARIDAERAHVLELHDTQSERWRRQRSRGEAPRRAALREQHAVAIEEIERRDLPA